jgi:hypothetical protein
MTDDFARRLHIELNGVAAMLIEKNQRYGNSALNPVRIFSKADEAEQLKVRMDDKLSRIRNLADDDDEDPIMDLIGYLFLFLIKRRERRERKEKK